MSTEDHQTNSFDHLIAHTKKQREEFESLTNKLELERKAIILDLQKYTDGISDTVSIRSVSDSEPSDYHPVKPPRECLLDLYVNRRNEILNRRSLMETLNYDSPNASKDNPPYRDYNQNTEPQHHAGPTNNNSAMTKNASDDRFSFHDFETGLPVYDGLLSSQQALNSQSSNAGADVSKQYTSDTDYPDSNRYYNEREVKPSSGYRESPYNESIRNTPYSNNVTEDPYAAHSVRDDPYSNNVEENPYASHAVREDPYSNNVTEDPYASHSVRDDPYSNNVAEDPYASHSVRNDPYSNNVEENPYASHSVRDEPYSNNVAENPYASHAVREDPYSNNAEENPYATHSVRDEPYSNNVAENPYASHSVRDEPYSNNVIEDPYASHAVRDEPYSNNVTEDPYASHAVRDDPYSNTVTEDPYATSAVRDDPYNKYNNTEDYEPVTAFAKPPNNDDNEQVNPSTGNYDGTTYESQDHGSFEVNDRFEDDRYRKPELSEVIELLHHPEAVVKLNAAAYLQHLSFMNDIVKQQTGALGGIPALVELVNHDKAEVQRAACGALRNLSYGRSNDDNKRAIKNSSGIPALVRLLRKSTNDDIHELVTAILWNLSSCKDLKKCIVDDALTVLVNSVIAHYSTNMMTIVFRNASGVLRNVSSDGEYARRKLRECESLVRTLLDVLKRATSNTTSPDTGSMSSLDSKSIENCTCTLRNLSYAAQESTDVDYHQRRRTDGYNTMPMTHVHNETKENNKVGCFGRNKKKNTTKKPIIAYQSELLRNNPARIHIEALWDPEVVTVYLPLLDYCTNPETTEAACACLQNLSACDWQPSVNIRIAVRKEKGLQIITNLLSLQSDKVIHSAAVTLRNLAIDDSNKQLISQYATEKLCSKLPPANPQQMQEFQVSDATICAVEAAIFQLVQDNPNCASIILKDGTVPKLIEIKTSPMRYSSKVIKFAIAILDAMWKFKDLHEEYKKKNLKESDFISKTLTIRKDNSYSTQTTLQRDNLVFDAGGTIQNSKEREIYYASSGSVANQAYNMNEFSTTSKTADYYSSSTLDNRTQGVAAPSQQGNGTLNSQQDSLARNSEVYAQVNRNPKGGEGGLVNLEGGDSAGNAADSWV